MKQDIKDLCDIVIKLEYKANEANKQAGKARSKLNSKIGMDYTLAGSVVDYLKGERENDRARLSK